MPMIDRRHFLATTIASAATALSAPVRADTLLAGTDLRGTIGAGDLLAGEEVLSAPALAFAELLATASTRRARIQLPPGRFELSGITLPEHVHLSGVPGGTELVYSGEGSFFSARNTKSLRLEGIRFDGANRWMGGETPALLLAVGVDDLVIDDCTFLGASGSAIRLEACRGTIRQTTVTGAADVAIFAVESRGLTIESNVVEKAGNGGILIHRWTRGADHSVVRNNRILGISAVDGGTGEHGNGINVFQADGVIVAGNHVSDCAFSAIRANSASDIRIDGNHCLKSGETAIYSEFAFEGAIIADNLVDGAANGISVVNLDHGGRLASVTGNLVRNLSLTGPYDNNETFFGVGISAEADCVVTGNVIEKAPRAGLSLGWGPFFRNVVASNNIVREAPIGCALSVVEGAGPATLANNQFSAISDAGIAGYRWLDKVTGDLVDNPGEAPAWLILSANSVTRAGAG